jgi:predicted transcriptional regulator YheO
MHIKRSSTSRDYFKFKFKETSATDWTKKEDLMHFMIMKKLRPDILLNKDNIERDFKSLKIKCRILLLLLFLLENYKNKNLTKDISRHLQEKGVLNLDNSLLHLKTMLLYMISEERS